MRCVCSMKRFELRRMRDKARFGWCIEACDDVMGRWGIQRIPHGNNPTGSRRRGHELGLDVEREREREREREGERGREREREGGKGREQTGSFHNVEGCRNNVTRLEPRRRHVWCNN